MFKKTFTTIDRFFKHLEEWSLFLTVCIALFTAMANVILRKATSDLSLYWSDEVVRKVIFFSTYMGCVAAIRHRSLIRIDALPQMFPALKRPLTLLSNISILIFSAVMVYLGWSMTTMMYGDEYARTATLQIPEYLFYAILPLTGAMMFLRTAINICDDWSAASTRGRD
ncbi:TRAP transporter small permease [Desulforhopalus singaporensis]|uniref:TRAP-type C4-dicarboxylate transport system, small permease component n=1 Tax=Desulforhopalus singaporensis TaxID=91360 RepID=A0A1H0J0L1_9BACT|nr:TRAP transporter small permease subunit [Desulforhopalus singaporensis]SDO37245.1 TRAP-type C4-dicarboxylate transport system, small permease component [Desulforhopalus singaporensis]